METFMLALGVLGFDLARWETWLTILAGLAFAGLIALVGLGPFFRDPTSSGGAALSLFGAVGTFLTERRRTRRKCSGDVRVVIADARKQTPLGEGLVLDCSLGGLRLSVSFAYEEGALLQVRNTSAPVNRRWAPVRVRYCQPLPGSRWVIGCEFVQSPQGCMGLLFE
jgi:hypothetical protein